MLKPYFFIYTNKKKSYFIYDVIFITLNIYLKKLRALIVILKIILLIRFLSFNKIYYIIL